MWPLFSISTINLSFKAFFFKTTFLKLTAVVTPKQISLLLDFYMLILYMILCTVTFLFTDCMKNKIFLPKYHLIFEKNSTFFSKFAFVNLKIEIQKLPKIIFFWVITLGWLKNKWEHWQSKIGFTIVSLPG